VKPESRATGPGPSCGCPRSRLPAALGVSLTLLLLLAGSAGPARGEKFGEYEVKAAFLYQFTRFVTWPQEDARNGTFGIGIVGDDPFGAALERVVAGKAVRGLPVVLRRFKRAADVDSCQIVFLGQEDDGQAGALLDRMRRTPVLTIGETRGFMDHGGIIRFRLENNRVRFEIAPRAAEMAHLKLSSKLYGVAEIVGH
jgi:hypothetical protein